MTVPLGASAESDAPPESQADGPSDPVEPEPEPARASPHAAPVSAREATEFTCPYLMSVGGAWRQATPSRDHRCGALDPPAPQPSDKQRRHCLSSAHVECPIYRAARAARAVALSPTGDRAAVAAIDAARRPIARTAPILLEQPRLVEQAFRLSFDRGSGQLALVALMILAFSVVAITRLSGGAAPVASPSVEPSGIARASASPSPTPRATPSPSAKPSASASATPEPSFRGLYTVQKGDTLLSIARRFKVHTGEIRRLNNLSPTAEVKPGQVLKIP
jgi:membrane-bound lytic murein transglycosylase D